MWPLTGKLIYEIILDRSCEVKHFEELFINGISTDSRHFNKNQMFVAIKGDNFDGHEFLSSCFQNGLALALVQKNSPSLNSLNEEDKLKCICVDNVIESLRKLAKFMRGNFNFPVIGIGGSNGKTTTKEILYSMLLGFDDKVTKTEKSENGFLGIAITLLQGSHKIQNPPSCLVLEIGIDDVGAMSKHIELSKPDIVLLTALGPEHLAGLGDWETAANEELILFSNPESTKIWQLNDHKIKKSFYENLKKKNLNSCANYIVIEKCDYEQYLNELSKYGPPKNKVEVIWTIVQENSAPQEIQIEINNSVTLEQLSNNFELCLPGRHNAANFALAFSAALAAGKNPNEISEGFKKFIPPPMRSNLVELPNGALLLNDTYNASPFSMQVALKIFENSVYMDKSKLLVLGDMLELGSESNYWHESLVPMLNKLKLAHLCLYGSAMYSCYKLLLECKDNFFEKNGSRVFWLDAKEDPARFFEDITLSLPESIILVKGSRSLKLERFVKILEEKCKS